MSTTVIDALLVTLGLDASDFNKNADAVKKAQKKLADQAGHSAKDIEQIEKRLSTAQAQRAKELEARSKQITHGLSKLRNEALGLLALFTAGMGIKQFAMSTINAGANMGRLADNLSMTTEKLAAYQMAAKDAGGTAEGMTAQLKESADAIAKYKLGQGVDDGMARFLQYQGDPAALKDGNTYLLARADIIAKMYKKDPTQAALMASQMHISDDAFNPLKQGSSLFEQQVANKEKLAKFTRQDAEQADILRKQMLDLTQKLELTATRILTDLAPSLIKIADGLEKVVNWLFPNEKKTSVGDPRRINSFFGFGKKEDFDARDGVKYNHPELNEYAASVEKRLGLPDGILNSVKNAGERSNSTAVSKKGAKGVMQFMPDTWKQYGTGDITDPHASIDAAGLYFKDLLKRYNGNVAAAITEYNGGTEQARAVQAGGRPWAPETINYTDRVMAEFGKRNASAAANMPVGAAASARASNGGNSTSTTDVKVGQINVQTQATDATGIAKSIGGAVSQYGFVSQANTGLQ